MRVCLLTAIFLVLINVKGGLDQDFYRLERDPLSQFLFTIDIMTKRLKD